LLPSRVFADLDFASGISMPGANRSSSFITRGGSAMARGDFNWIPFTHTYTANDPSFTAEFRVEGDPIDDAYLLITAHNVSSQGHQIFINNQELPSWDIPIHDPGWQTWMDHIEPGVLHSGVNSIMVVRTGGDDVTTKDVVVHWRE
jgi:hypothetical protein